MPQDDREPSADLSAALATRMYNEINQHGRVSEFGLIGAYVPADVGSGNTKLGARRSILNAGQSYSQ